jgi:hypothetical protein
MIWLGVLVTLVRGTDNPFGTPNDFEVSLFRDEANTELRVWCADYDRPQLDLGLTFLSQSAVFIDYQNAIIGFCEPL